MSSSGHPSAVSGSVPRAAPGRWRVLLALTIASMLWPAVALAGRSTRATAKVAAGRSARDAASTSWTYRVRRGDTLTRISRRLGVSTRVLKKLNPALSRRGYLRPGRRLKYCRVGCGLPAARAIPPRRRGPRFCQLTDGPGYRVRRPERAWGTLLTVTRIQDVTAAYSRRFPDQPLLIHDISRRSGGRMSPHRSHRTGRDVDIRVPLTYRTDRYVRATPKTLDRERTWYLFRTLIDTGDVEYIFIDRRLQVALYRHALSSGVPEEELQRLFEYPRPGRSACQGKARCRSRSQAIIRHEPGHSAHFHVRFRREKRTVPVS